MRTIRDPVCVRVVLVGKIVESLDRLSVGNPGGEISISIRALS
jgi:hypothetical protein